MDTRTTLADARAALYDLINVDDPDDPKFLRVDGLNQMRNESTKDHHRVPDRQSYTSHANVTCIANVR